MSCSIGRISWLQKDFFVSFIVTFFIPRTGWALKRTGITQTINSKLLSYKTIFKASLWNSFSLHIDRKLKHNCSVNLHHISSVMCRPWLNNEVQALSHPHEVHRVLRSLPMAESQSSTTVLETGRLIRSVIVLRQQWRLKWANAQPGGIRTHFPRAQQLSWRCCCRFMERLAGIVN